MKLENQSFPVYCVNPDTDLVKRAIQSLEKTMGDMMQSPQAVKAYLTLKAGDRPDQHREVFAVLFLDSQNQVINYEELFIGTLNATAVYPREVARAALRLNASAVVLTHNHPSGFVQPSRSDEQLTQTIKKTLELFDIRVLDHIITGGNQSVSMAELGLI